MLEIAIVVGFEALLVHWLSERRRTAKVLGRGMECPDLRSLLQSSPYEGYSLLDDTKLLNFRNHCIVENWRYSLCSCILDELYVSSSLYRISKKRSIFP